jgi:mono/diheme cytochrome c family protein
MKYLISFLVFNLALFAQVSGKKVFETYCWGCHHQTSEAFGPPFEQIASKRTKEEIRAMIANPKAVSKMFGYKRNAMPAFNLKEDELKAITNYILSYKPKNGKSDKNSTKSK